MRLNEILLRLSHFLALSLSLSLSFYRSLLRAISVFSLRNSPGTRIIFTKVSCFYFVHLRCFTKKKKTLNLSSYVYVVVVRASDGQVRDTERIEMNSLF